MRLTKVGFAVSAALLASACSDDDSSPSVVEPAKLNFSIQGIATDAPVSNAAITATIGDKVITTTANATGLYSLDFEYEDGSLTGSEMVQITAKGEGDQAHIELTSQLGSFGSLIEQAGDDATLEQEESSRTAITQISTAMHVLTKQLGKDITSDEALMAAESSVDVETLLEISAIIKVLADNPDYTPENEESILDILTASDQGVETSLEDYFAKNKMLDESGELIPELFKAVEQAKQQTIEDPSVTPNFTRDEIEGTYVLHASVADGWVPAYGDVLRINENSQAWVTDTSRYYDLTNDDDANWTVMPTGQLYISSLNSNESQNYWSLDDIVDFFGEEILATLPQPHSPSYRVIETLRGIKLTKLTKGKESKVAAKYIYQKTLDDPELADFAWPDGLPTTTIESDQTAVLSKTDQENLIWQEAPSGDWVLPVISDIKGLYDQTALPYIVHQQVKLDDNMSVLDSAGNDLGKWAFESGKLTITSPDDWSISYQPYTKVDGLISAQVSVSIDDKQQHSLKWIAPFAQQESTLADDFVQEMPNILGAWINAWRVSDNNAELPDIGSVYGYNFTENGEASWVWTMYDEENKPYFFTEESTFQQWSTPEEHQYLLTGNVNYGDYIRERERTWTTIGTLENGQHLVLEYSHMRQGYPVDPNSFEEGYWVFPRINVLKPIDLSVYEEAYQLSKEKGSITE
ncbi:hypothetical protein VA249_02000 [Vibrio alfacsensis]|uniref:carboxypeptidase-like regulatory domain-containing protein n=1 Tax=Vibrio alfacsensis TaxID=1074311 RepID=UPI001BEDED38|nr:carboxypeptidase-like regulatory domain-containing protein [Vibrio alfacsensis]BBM63554.1 hypothetical protein VA249_02000 [Vibrio alfacsensis]